MFRSLLLMILVAPWVSAVLADPSSPRLKPADEADTALTSNQEQAPISPPQPATDVPAQDQAPAPVLSPRDIQARRLVLDLPDPDLAGLEPIVAEQLERSRKNLVELLDQGAEDAEVLTALGELARQYQAYGMLAAAEISYRNLLRMAPDRAAENYLLAMVLSESGQVRDALNRLGITLDLVANDADATVLVRLRRADLLLQQGDLEAARLDCLQAWYLNPRAIATVARLGELALLENRPQLAIGFLEPAIQAQPEANRLFYLLGMAWRAMGDEEQSRAMLARSGETGVSPPDPWMGEVREMLRGERAHILRGLQAVKAGDAQAAAEAYRAALASNPDSVAALINLGAVLFAQGQGGAAAEKLERALALDPTNSSARYNLANIALQNGDPALARAHLETLLQQSPQDADLLHLMGVVQRDLGETDQALEYFRRAVLADPTRIDAWLEGAELLTSLGRDAEAREVLQIARDKLPNSGDILHALAVFLATTQDLTLRDGPEAVRLAESIWQAEPTLAHGETLVLAMAESDRCDDAQHFQAELLQRLEGVEQVPDTDRERLRARLNYLTNNRPCRPNGTF